MLGMAIKAIVKKALRSDMRVDPLDLSEWVVFCITLCDLLPENYLLHRIIRVLDSKACFP
jgi:hypothetical protein